MHARTRLWVLPVAVVVVENRDECGRSHVDVSRSVFAFEREASTRALNHSHISSAKPLMKANYVFIISAT
jgi:hypothetical protein